MRSEKTLSKTPDHLLSGFTKWPGAVGLIFGLLPLLLHLTIPPLASLQFAALLLVLIAGIYLGFAFQDGRVRIILTELICTLFFLGAAIVSLHNIPAVIIAAFIAHGLWDLAHHRLVDTKMPRWYIPLCAVYDWAAAMGLWAIWYHKGML